MNNILNKAKFFAAIAMGFMAPIAADNPQLNADVTLYLERCTQCHSIELASNDDTVLPSEVFPMIQRMIDLPGSLIQPEEKKRLYQVALYFIYLNQKEALDKKLNSISEKQKKKEIEALKKALEPYKK